MHENFHLYFICPQHIIVQPTQCRKRYFAGTIDISHSKCYNFHRRSATTFVERARKEEDLARNIEKDRHEEARRRKHILESGLKLFSEQGIESVSMNAVAAASGVGPTTLFKYYQNKEKLVISISAMAWKNIWQETLSQYGEEDYSKFSAREMIRIYTSSIIRIYQERPELLRFSGNYKTFLCRQDIQAGALREHLDPLKPMQTMFYQAYMRAKTDHSIRTDISEEVLFTTVAIGMLAIAERYAQGIIWADRGETDHTQELQIAQEMILNWCAGGKTDLPSASI